ncbi:unnamed protein product (mitochondrion) [Plasmodiophora brassicae]|uniref:Uncharacterized protein n=2 Tax=Plasmodiophora brassicae TaxID=37360 RepID=A0A3P3Y4V5_PLABS|nr:unnamed protein product [Plasmodiophora brassicae]
MSSPSSSSSWPGSFYNVYCSVCAATGLAAVGGAASGPAAAMAVINALGYTAAGIASESAAAAAMSAAAIANGGGVAAGSTVAVLQSVGAAGLGASGCAIASAAGAVVASTSVAIVAVSIKMCRSFLDNKVWSYPTNVWFIATEEGIWNVCVYVVGDDEKEAHEAFGSICCSRILYNPAGQEVDARGVNWLAHKTIRDKVRSMKNSIH